jgi:hypothetical protein
MHRDWSLWRPILRNVISTEQTFPAFMLAATAENYLHNQPTTTVLCKGVAY